MENVFKEGMETLRARWRVMLVLGVASIVLGALAIAASFTATMLTVFFLGCLIFGGGIVHFIESFETRGWSGFFGHALAAVLYVVAGLYMITNPAASAVTLTLVIGMVLAVGGIYQMISSIATRFISWGWSFVHGAVSLALGILIFRQWPISALWVIGVFVGIDLIMRGWSTLMIALAARSTVGAAIERVQEGFEDRRLGLADRRAA